MKVALVHDYLNEFGGAERVLRVLSDMYPKAPIYTAFVKRRSTADKEFSDRQIIESSFAPLLKIWKLYSPLRFLIPWIWGSMDLSKYDLIITSSSSYIARGFKTGKNTKVICYCHTPPKYLYGYQTSIDMQKYWPVRIYAAIVNHFLRMFDWESAQKVDVWVANSENVKARIDKHYRKGAVVIYPPVDVDRFIKAADDATKEDYFFIASRLVGGKGIESAAIAATKLGLKLKIAGESAGYSNVSESLKSKKVEVLGRVSDAELAELYAKARGFLALERDVDFGITPVESMAAGTPVIALDSGGFRETVIDGRTGIFVEDTKSETIKKAINKLNKTKWDKKALQSQAKKFTREKFERQFLNIVRSIK